MIHKTATMRMAICHQVMPLSFLRKMKMSVSLLQTEMVRNKTNVSANNWNQDSPMVFVKTPKHNGTKHNAKRNTRMMMGFIQK